MAKKSIALKLVAGGLVVAAAGMAAGAMLFPVTHETTVTKEVIKTVEVPGPVTTEVQTVEVPVEKVVYVDNGKLADVLQSIYDADGDVQYVTTDLDDTEIALIADRLVWDNDVLAIAENAVRDQAFDVLHKELINGTKLDRTDMERLRVMNDKGDMSIVDRDYDDKDADVLVMAKFEQDDVKYEADFLVVIKDGELDDVVVDDIRTR